MKLVLTSGGITNTSIESKIRELAKSNIKIAFIPTAANVEDGDKLWLIDDLIKCKELGSVDIVDISAVEKDIWLPRLKEANVIVMGGGSTPHLIYWIKKSGLAEVLPELLQERLYVGISAGSMVLSKTTQTDKEFQFKLYEDEVENPQTALGLIDFHIRPHLNSPYFPKVVERNLNQLFKDSPETIYALDDNSAVVYNSGEVEVISEGSYKKYQKN